MQMNTHTHAHTACQNLRYIQITQCNELKQQPRTGLHTLDKALSKDNKPREFSHISESHKSPSLSTSSEKTADISINVTTARRPMKCCNRSIITEWDEEGIRCAPAAPVCRGFVKTTSQHRLEAFFFFFCMRCEH